MKNYRLRKSLHVFRHVLHLYKRKKKKLPELQKKEIVKTLNHLQEEILNRDREEASRYAHAAEDIAKSYLFKKPLERFRDFILALVFALVVATLVRTMWFEFYEIPTGSMRPTLHESDRLVVSKTTFGVNIPLYAGHIFFEPALVQRASTIIFTGIGMDIPDLDTMYFYVFPGKKQFVKRLIGKPGDILYFYGGLIYGIDKEGNDISQELQPDILSKIDHVPYIYFNGRVDLPSKPTGNVYTPAILRQMNQKVAKISMGPYHQPSGTLLDPYKHGDNDYYDLWGFKNYGMARILTKEEVLTLTDTPPTQLQDAPLYLEIFHHPSIKHPSIERNRDGRLYPGVGISQAVLPLSEENLKTLFGNIYTARFIVKDEVASRYGSSFKAGKDCRICVPLKGVPDGTYEFYYGIGYKVLATGLRTKLPSNHPLYTFTPEHVQTLYNLGIEWLTPFSPAAKIPGLLPSRYVYYRDGDLYAMGAPLMKKDDASLVNFIQNEYLKQQNAPTYRPYIPFDDSPPPFDKDGKIDQDFLKQYGILVPPKHYLVLGDNYAMSADSRDFGFVPESNIRGAPAYIFWPPGPHMGPLLQPTYPLFNSPRFAIWCLVIVIFIIWWIRHHKQNKLPIKIDEH
ncbi:signal peptidase I [Simkania negevensis]|nr:signal peptidase I [Simkania negevensis]